MVIFHPKRIQLEGHELFMKLKKFTEFAPCEEVYARLAMGF